MCAACHCDRTWRSAAELQQLRCWHATPRVRVRDARLCAGPYVLSRARSAAVAAGPACPPRLSRLRVLLSARLLHPHPLASFARRAENAGTDLAVREHGSANRGAHHCASQPRNLAGAELGSCDVGDDGPVCRLCSRAVAPTPLASRRARSGTAIPACCPRATLVYSRRARARALHHASRACACAPQ
eukprot:5909468-Prymnesium_polylepis.3